MPCGRMQHTAALPRDKSCSAYAVNAIASTWKKNFLQTFYRLPKLWNEIGKLGLIFFSNWLIPFWNPLLIIRRCAASFDETDNLPIKFLGRAAKPTQCPHILVALRNFRRAALPHFAAVCHAAWCGRTFRFSSCDITLRCTGSHHIE